MREGLWALATFVAALTVAGLATPLVSRMALALDVVDRPNERKVSHRSRMPLLGGLSVALGFFVGVAVALQLMPPTPGVSSSIETLLVGGLLVLALGAVDDRWGLGAWPKLTVQIAAAAVAIHHGTEIDHATNPFSGEVVQFPQWLTYLVTTAWIVIVTNSINLIDGLDGLCTGISAIIAITLTVVAFQAGHDPVVVAGLALSGALLGFLPFNFPPARIFVGDTGALFVGYCLAILALEGYQRATVITFLVPLLAFAVPLLDTSLSILRRIRARKGVMQADRMHMHHRLLREYHGDHRPAVLSLYGLTACFCLIAVSFTRLEGIASLVFLLVVALLTLRILRNLGFASIEEPGPTPAEAAAISHEEEERR
jgi:UDP-GlcNAc:undecaprenyl-phosphate GlcNAc-1-phosphate transferase